MGTPYLQLRSKCRSKRTLIINNKSTTKCVAGERYVEFQLSEQKGTISTRFELKRTPFIIQIRLQFPKIHVCQHPILSLLILASPPAP